MESSTPAPPPVLDPEDQDPPVDLAQRVGSPPTAGGLKADRPVPAPGTSTMERDDADPPSDSQLSTVPTPDRTSDEPVISATDLTSGGLDLDDRDPPATILGEKIEELLDPVLQQRVSGLGSPS